MELTVKTDVLVVGGGAAGCRAAIEANDAGAKVLLAVKGGFGRVSGLRGTGASGCAGSPLGFSDIPHVVGGSRVEVKPEDEQQLLYDLMIQAGLGMADPKLLKVMLSKAPEAKQGLRKWGLVSDEFPPYVHCFITPVPGLNYVVRSRNIDILEDTMIISLLKKDGQISGAAGINEKTGDAVLISAKEVIIATGGAGMLYQHHFQPSCVTGDGYVLAYDAGASLINMEFHQAIWATVYPTVNIMPGLWGACPRFMNKDGREFLEKHIPDRLTVKEVMQCKLQHWPFSARDDSRYIDIGAIKEAREGGSNEHHAFCIPTEDFRDSWELLMVPQSREYLQFRGIDWNKPFIEANVAYHCQNGGIRIDENARTDIPGLYAVGECAAGPFGVDRIAGSMMASGQTFAMIAGRDAAANARSIPQPDISKTEIENAKMLKHSLGGKGNPPFEYIKRLQISAWDNMLIVKDSKSLCRLQNVIAEIDLVMENELIIRNTRDMILAEELKKLLKLGRIISTAASERKETRGNFYREDYPQQDDQNYLHSILVYEQDGKIQTEAFKRDPDWVGKNGDMNELSWG